MLRTVEVCNLNQSTKCIAALVLNVCHNLAAGNYSVQELVDHHSLNLQVNIDNRFFEGNILIQILLADSGLASGNKHFFL